MKNSINPLEALFFKASEEVWCWKLACTTCGNLHFRYSFQEIINGKHPIDNNWIIYRHKTSYFEELGNYPREFRNWELEKLMDFGLQLDLKRIAENCKFPDWLGYIGLLIIYTENTSSKNFLKFSNHLKHELLSLFQNDDYQRRCQEIFINPNELIQIRDLEKIEKIIEMTIDRSESFHSLNDDLFSLF